ncbi:hypothetical protein J1605_012503 [Eschrichtius robustus]|uniref:Uncharacterized protein n=1 Tax=Eschrichtius robustus TaxID=9764 RepID=A0AB34GJM9_ESCRO|nr:hypothetical protein J1605_012503 [Eschrichtius robustus]
MAAAAQLSLTQVTPPASPPGSDGRCPRPPPPPSYECECDWVRTPSRDGSSTAAAATPPRPVGAAAPPHAAPPPPDPAVPPALLGVCPLLSLQFAFTHPGSFLLPGQKHPSLFSAELVAMDFSVGAHPSLPACPVVSPRHLVVSLAWIRQGI